jgi:hypothetical protein
MLKSASSEKKTLAWVCGIQAGVFYEQIKWFPAKTLNISHFIDY